MGNNIENNWAGGGENYIIEMEKAEMYRNGMSREEARKKLFERIGAPGKVITLRNINDGEEALLSKRSVRKLLSGAASNKSEANGFTPAQHFAVASDIDYVFANSIKILERPDRDGNPDIIILNATTPKTAFLSPKLKILRY